MWTSLSCDTKKNVSLYTMLHGCRYQVDRIRKNSWKIWIECRLTFSNYNSPWRILPLARPPLLRRSTVSYKKRKISWMWSRRWSQRVSSAPQRWAMRIFDPNNLNERIYFLREFLLWQWDCLYWMSLYIFMHDTSLCFL